MFCTDCVFRVRVGSAEITEVPGTGMEVTEVPGRYTDVFTCIRTRVRVLYKCIPVLGYSTSAYLYPGTLQVHTCTRERELTEVPGTGLKPSSHTAVAGTGMEVLQNSQMFPVRVWKSYNTPYPYPGIFTRAYPYPGCCATGVHNLSKGVSGAVRTEAYRRYIPAVLPAPDTLVSSVRHQYRYRTLQQLRYDINTDTGHFDNFVTTSIPVPDTSTTSLRHPYRHRE